MITLQKPLSDAVIALSNTVAAKDPFIVKHQLRVAHIACAIAQKMGADREFIEGMRVIGLLHDLGKIAVPDNILCKPGKLTGHEFELIKNHPQIAYDILKKIHFPWPVALAILQHHERLDGSGYPHGFGGKDIILEARILAVADVVAAITSDRPYRPALGRDEALKEISEKSGVLYDLEVCSAFLEINSSRFRGFRYGRLLTKDPQPADAIPSGK